MRDAAPLVRIGHSPDADDAFMFHALVNGKVGTEGLRVEQVHQDIETLNRRALRGDLELTAVSIHAYAHLRGRYRLLRCGASMGDGHGPRVVARGRMSRGDLRAAAIAVPGRLTSAYLALGLYLGGPFRHEEVPFDRILDEVAAGRFDAGLVIHEGQLTYADRGLRLVADLGQWWGAENDGLPLPLGANAVRADLDDDTTERIARMLRASIDYALAHRDEALAYAGTFGRGLDRGRTDAFVRMYVNDWTRELGPRGCEAVQRFLDRGHDAGFLPARVVAEFVAA
jgi:1,4-dihydroxy-6-naphthoate synthase